MISICAGLLILLFLILTTWPAIGANGADTLRSLIGDKAVAALEMAYNQAQDSLQRLKYDAGLDKPGAPWATSAPPVQTPTPEITGTLVPADTPIFITPPALQPAPPVEVTPLLITTPAPPSWPPHALSAMGNAPGEGLWSVYFQDAAGETVAYRTFLQPDPGRPYTVVAVVAMDITRARLHFVLGTIEPAGVNVPSHSGAIPPSDRLPGVLLAAFNGGFKARHGQFGAMSGGITALPPRDGLGTVVIYQDGSVKLGEWGPEVGLSPDVAAYRQNGPLVIQHGQVNPQIHNNNPEDWGYTVIDVSPTIRTGIGLSRDEKTLYYFVGPSLSMETLAAAMQSAGAWNAIQLDINNYWALFVKFQPSGANVIPQPLLPELMVANVERYLWDYTRDYFYLTGVK